MQLWELIGKSKQTGVMDAQTLWSGAMEYFKWADEHPIILSKTITSGKEAGKAVEESKVRPYSIKALCIYLGLTQEYLKDVRLNSDKDSDFYLAIERILLIVFVQNSEMATIGEFNPVFTAKLLNIDSPDEGPKKITIEYVGDLPKLSNSESEILEKLDLEKME
jgi:hypothetical protein